jgi:hypothetical protein
MLKINILPSVSAHSCNPSYLGDQGSRSAQANTFQDPISKITREKWTRGMDQEVEYLLFKHKGLS